MCPNHIDKELLAIDPNVRARSTPLSDLSFGTRTYKIRRPKRTTIFEPALQRGYKNNGLIEIANEEDWDEQIFSEYGRTPRLSERSIKLDFIDKVRK